MNEHHQPFEEIKLINANGAEQWSARQLGKLLGYSEYRHFIPVLTRAKEACENSGHTIDDHFEEILDMVKIGLFKVILDVIGSKGGFPAPKMLQHEQNFLCVRSSREAIDVFWSGGN